jgi:hypothetical protein
MGDHERASRDLIPAATSADKLAKNRTTMSSPDGQVLDDLDGLIEDLETGKHLTFPSATVVR